MRHFWTVVPFLRAVFGGALVYYMAAAIPSFAQPGMMNNTQKQAAAQPVSEIDGRDLGGFVVSWWRWLMNAPDGSDILADDSGSLCDLGQSGDVWYLAGSYKTGKIMRRCVVVQDKYIFIPVMNTMLWDSADGGDCSLLQDKVKAAIDTVHDLFLEIDGRKAENLSHYRAAPRQCFRLPGERDIYASDGYWVLLKPLSKGHHVIRFGGKIGDDGETVENSMQNIEYRIDVE